MSQKAAKNFFRRIMMLVGLYIFFHQIQDVFGDFPPWPRIDDVRTIKENRKELKKKKNRNKENVLAKKDIETAAKDFIASLGQTNANRPHRHRLNALERLIETAIFLRKSNSEVLGSEKSEDKSEEISSEKSSQKSETVTEVTETVTETAVKAKTILDKTKKITAKTILDNIATAGDYTMQSKEPGTLEILEHLEIMDSQFETGADDQNNQKPIIIKKRRLQKSLAIYHTYAGNEKERKTPTVYHTYTVTYIPIRFEVDPNVIPNVIPNDTRNDTRRVTRKKERYKRYYISMYLDITVQVVSSEKYSSPGESPPYSLTDEENEQLEDEKKKNVHTSSEEYDKYDKFVSDRQSDRQEKGDNDQEKGDNQEKGDQQEKGDDQEKGPFQREKENPALKALRLDQLPHKITEISYELLTYTANALPPKSFPAFGTVLFH